MTKRSLDSSNGASSKKSKQENLFSTEAWVFEPAAKEYILAITDPKGNNVVQFTEVENEDDVPDKSGLAEVKVIGYEGKYYALIPVTGEESYFYWKLKGLADGNSITIPENFSDLLRFLPYKTFIQTLKKSGKPEPFQTQAAANTATNDENTQTQVAFTDRIHNNEKVWVNKIKTASKDKLSKWTGITAKKPLNIAVCASGGGIRAALATRFFMYHLSKNDPELFSSISYFAGLSGSTWFLTDWCFNNNLYVESNDYATRDKVVDGASGIDIGIKAVNELHHMFSDMTSPNVIRNNYILEHFALALGGAYFPDDYRKDDFLLTHRMSKLKDKLAPEKPWPIMTSITGSSKPEEANIDWRKILQDQKKEFPFEWVEYTPEQVCHVIPGTKFAWKYVIPSAFGCTVNQNNFKEKSLSQDSLAQLLALWGSAITVTTNELKNQEVDPFADNTSPPKPEEKGWMERIFSSSESFKSEPFMFPSWENSSTKLAFRDAGIAFNLPFPPLLEKERGVDVILTIDGSGDLHTDAGGNELIKAAIWAERKGKPFPVTSDDLIKNYKKTGKLKAPQIFQKQGAPVVIYIPVVINEAELRIDTTDLSAADVKKRKKMFETTSDLWKNYKANVKEVIKNLVQ